MSVIATPDAIISSLNDAQRAAVAHGDGPLLVIAGAGTGKTKTLVHRVARLIHSGVDPARILLMTFTRRAAAEMLRRVQKLLTEIENETDDARGIGRAITQRVWGGTFHATATRLLRAYGQLIGLDPAFTIHDRGDSEDFLDVVRTELDLAKDDKRFPRKGTCLSIYSHCVNSQLPIEKVLAEHFPWCADFADELKRLCKAYVDRKDQASVLDYDDLLLFFHGLLADDRAGAKIRERFECVLVDEYQDTNNLQAETLRLLKPDGRGVTVVGDDAQSIYSFRAASVRNILDFPNQFPNVTVVKLEQNYRSTSKILSATNTVIAQSSERFEKNLWSERSDGVPPQLVQCMDEAEQSDFLVRQILSHREAGIDLRRQAVLFRAAHHSILLEADLARAKIPFVKYGGLKFIETAHVKDLMGFLRLAENPRDVVSGSRILMLLPGVGPKRARQLMDVLVASGGRFEAWRDQRVPDEARELWEKLVALMLRLASAGDDQLVPQVSAVRQFYDPLLETKYDQPQPRQRDLEQLEQVAARFSDRATMLAEMALDPPNSTQDLAGEPLLDDDYLILSTMHSAKGLEWDAVYVIHAADGNVPSDMATKSTEQIEEERRLFYVGLTRAKTWLYVCHPLRYYHANRGPKMDRYGMSQLTRFLPKTAVKHFDQRTAVQAPHEAINAPHLAEKRADVRAKVRGLWG